MSNLRIYASGSGALSFVWVEGKNGNATGERVTMEQATQRIIHGKNPYSAFRLVMTTNEPELIPDVKKSGDGVLFDDRFFVKVNGHWCTREGENYTPIRNISMLGALRYYEENPQFYKEG